MRHVTLASLGLTVVLACCAAAPAQSAQSQSARSQAAQSQAAQPQAAQPQAAAPAPAQSAKPQPPRPPVQEQGGKLIYTTNQRGDRVVDFSLAGFRAGDEQIPDVAVQRIALGPSGDDNTRALQAAIDQMAGRPVAKGGFRGALLIPPGDYPLTGGLTIRSSGIVIRGGGAFGTDQSTRLIATGPDRRTLIRIAGEDDRTPTSPPIAVAGEYVPVGATVLRLAVPHSLKVGDTVTVRRPSTAEWIAAMGMADLGGDRHGPSWKPGSRDVTWDRTITAVTADTITLDAPITASLDPAYGVATVEPHTWPGRITNIGIENLELISQPSSDNPRDEDHAWMGITIENARDVWVRRVRFSGFVCSAVAVWESARRVTVEDCISVAPVSEIGGWRRRPFLVLGQQVLMHRLYSENAVHDFAVGLLAAGPNAFVQCDSVNSLGHSGAIDSYATGVLFDHVRIDGNSLSLRNRAYEAAGAGWTADNSVLWNADASVIECWKTPTGMNYAIGTWGEFSGDGHFASSNDDPDIQSLYWAQLEDRLGPVARERRRLLTIDTNASSAPSVEQAMELAQITLKPRPSLRDFILEIARIDPLSPAAAYTPTVTVPSPVDSAGQRQSVETRPLSLAGGWLLTADTILTGRRVGVPWWNLGLRTTDLARAGPALTRFVPGRIGHGHTDDLPTLADALARSGRVAVEQHPPLWYERRRDDHERIRRMDADVVAPFYEWPFARSGRGRAYDGLSQWDLTRPNPWYYARLQQFADLAEVRGLVLLNHHYMQHSILEAGAHYTDFPWRTANNINNTPFPEPVYYAGDKRVFIGEQFYDVSNPALADLHRQYIRQQLDHLAGRSNVIHVTSEEFTGSLPFVQFWLDTIAQWQQQTGRDVMVSLCAPRDVQDAVLADSARATVVDVIDIRYWWYQGDGEPYAPPGGKNLAPRQWQRLLKPKGPSFESTARAVRQYRLAHPDKAVIWRVEQGEAGWASLMGGGSLAAVPRLDPALARAIATMRPVDPAAGKLAAGQYLLASPDGGDFLLYRDQGAPATFNLRLADHEFVEYRIDPDSGAMTQSDGVIAGGFSTLDVGQPHERGPVVVWIHRIESQ